MMMKLTEDGEDEDESTKGKKKEPAKKKPAGKRKDSGGKKVVQNGNVVTIDRSKYTTK